METGCTQPLPGASRAVLTAPGPVALSARGLVFTALKPVMPITPVTSIMHMMAAGLIAIAAMALGIVSTASSPSSVWASPESSPGASMEASAGAATADSTRVAAASTGSLSGAVRIGPRLMGRKIRFSLYPDVNRAPDSEATPSMAAEMSNVVVYLESSPALSVAPVSRGGPYRMEQAHESFVPHVLTVVTGTVVDFPNTDPIYHNVFSLSKSSSFDLGRYPNGSARSVRFDRPGVVKVFCHIHSDMSAVVLVLDNPFFTTPDTNGAYTMSGIPPGHYVATGWHERARPIHREVTIEAGRTSVVDLAIPLEDEPDGR
jgi:plastocyanin